MRDNTFKEIQEKSPSGRERIYHYPLFLALILSASLFAVSLSLMVMLRPLAGLPVRGAAVFHPLILAVTIFPMIYLFLLRPLRMHIIAKNRSDRELRISMQSEDYVKTILHSMNISLTVIDGKGTVTAVNDAALRLLGYTEDELIGSPVDRIFEADPKEQDREVMQLLTTGNITGDETRYIKKDGRRIPVSFASSIIGGSNGEVQGIVCTAQDMSGQKRREEALRGSEEYYRSLVETSQDCMCNITLDGTYMSMNPAGCELNAVESGENIIGAKCTDNIIKNRKTVEAALKKASQGESVSVEFKTTGGKGSGLWWDSTFTPVRDVDRSIKSILQVSRDITHQKTMEQHLLDAQKILADEHEELRALFKKVEKSKREWENTMDCLGSMIALTDKNGAVIKYNRAFMDFTGREKEGLTGKDWEVLLTENGMETVRFSGGSIELFHRPSRRWFTLNSYPFKDDELEREGSVISIHETTEMKNIAEELEKAYKDLQATQSQILQREKMASIGQLAAGVAHEINNPMGFITSNLGTLGTYTDKLRAFISIQSGALQSDQSAVMPEEIEQRKKELKIDYVLTDINDLIRESLEGAERVKKIVQNLKSFSRVDRAEYTHADLNECMESTLNIVWNELKYKTTVEKDYGNIPLTRCYPQQMNQVFMNLLVNAADAIDKQGTIKIKSWNGNGYVNVSISDTGCGIAEDRISRVFEPFYTTKEVGKGTGLGLSISYEIVKKHKGEFLVDSEIGGGTTFTVKIPVAEDEDHG